MQTDLIINIINTITIMIIKNQQLSGIIIHEQHVKIIEPIEIP